jgi:hypothetical protein
MPTKIQNIVKTFNWEVKYANGKTDTAHAIGALRLVSRPIFPEKEISKTTPYTDFWYLEWF